MSIGFDLPLFAFGKISSNLDKQQPKEPSALSNARSLTSYTCGPYLIVKLNSGLTGVLFFDWRGALIAKGLTRQPLLDTVEGFCLLYSLIYSVLGVCLFCINKFVSSERKSLPKAINLNRNQR